MLHSTPKFRVPTPCFERLADSPFSSYSLSSCVAVLFELSELPGRWEEHPDWHEQLTRWAGNRGFQIIEFEIEDPVVGYNLRTVANPDHFVANEDGDLEEGIEFLLFYGNELKFNPSQIEINPEKFGDGKVVFVPLDPAAAVVTYN